MIQLVNKKEECCGCGACIAVCPVQAIKMSEDEYGFIYPHIDEKKCLECGRCEKNCEFQTQSGDKNISTFAYAAYNRNEKARNQASSGGIFEQIGSWIIDNGGYVAGAILDFDRGGYHTFTIL